MDTKKHNQPLSKPDPETLHTTDPQEHMEGPLSSSVQEIRETAEENDHPGHTRRDEEGNEQLRKSDDDEAE